MSTRMLVIFGLRMFSMGHKTHYDLRTEFFLCLTLTQRAAYSLMSIVSVCFQLVKTRWITLTAVQCTHQIAVGHFSFLVIVLDV
jgi:hypothetical protein